MLDLTNRIKSAPPKRSPVARARERKLRSAWKAWTCKDESTLREMAGKHSTGEIAKALDRSARAVEQRAHLLDISLSTRGLDPLMIDMARVLHAAGYTPGQIIHTFNVPTGKAKAIERDLANPQPPRGHHHAPTH